GQPLPDGWNFPSGTSEEFLQRLSYVIGSSLHRLFLAHRKCKLAPPGVEPTRKSRQRTEG
ncbi:MAG TPA: hypothetical protein VJR89_09105, partial [Polyangiales bacterium]|nr:hypothetical protein [Polyangiales bacterium]